ncbi:MAG: 50S ribosomal protein L17 [Candidatus Paceibacterota bacterium]|jgi:large subunit ribosomal protein L17
MKHHKAMRTLGREKKQRNALLNSLARSLVLKKKIKTTEARARELGPFSERLVTKAKQNTLASRRALIVVLGKDAAGILMEKIAPDYKNRAGGYTRLTKLGVRASDGAKLAVIEFV